MASKRRIRRKSCGDKIQHKDQTAAVCHLIAMKKNGKNTSGMRSYKCHFGNHWHIGHFR